LLKRVLALFGLAPARLAASQAQLIEKLREGSLAWKTKADDARARLKTADAEIKRKSREIQKLSATAEKLRQRLSEIDRLRARVVEAERMLLVAREQLMAIDVKLDILEGAANVLDTRTRVAVSKQHSGVGAPV
jgi:chromosome segregation ATPase